MLKSSLCIAVALACSPMASSARHVGPELVGSVPGAAWLPVAVHDQTGTAKLSNLPDLLSRGIQPAGLALAGEVRRSTLSGGQDMGWVWMPALSDASIRQQAKQFFQSGVPVLVLGAPVTEAERRAIASVFGAASQASVAVYLRGKDGGLQVFSFHAPAAMPGVNLRAPLEQLVQGVENALASAQEVTSRSKRSLLRAASDATDPGELHALPRMNVIETQYASSKNGASVTLDATVIRNSTKDKDVFTIIAHSRYNLKPHDSGLSGGVLTVPYRYTMKQGIGINSDTIVPKLADQFPGSDPRTDLQTSEKRATKTNYGFGIKPEISADLQGNVPTASAKIAFSFDYARENIYEKVVNFSAKDYFLSSSANSSLPRKKTAEWTMQLAPSIFGDKEHFGKSPSTTLVTPTMLSSAPETLAVWELDAKYQGPISLDAQSVIENAKFDGKASPQIAPDPQWQAVVNLYIPADSPYLTRETTVFIRSEKGSGGCLWDAMVTWCSAHARIPIAITSWRKNWRSGISTPMADISIAVAEIACRYVPVDCRQGATR